jgi:2-polyprenyl-3-methyl-5-hydroxy-6-metoxy-1,4-benzoquinol methylase
VPVNSESKLFPAEREAILGAIAGEFPNVAAMVRKNWRRYARVVGTLEEAFPDRAGIRIIDFGCGYPVVVKLLQLRGFMATGYEPYADDLQSRLARALGLEGTYTKILKDGDRFDVLLLVDVIEHLAVPGPTMHLVGEQLKPGGVLLVSTPNVLRFETYWNFLFRRTGHPTPLAHYLRAENTYVTHQREFTMDELRRTLEFFGFEVTRAEFNDVRPSKEEAEEHRALTGQEGPGKGLKGLVAHFVIRFLPASVARDNLMVLATRKC